MKKGLLIVISGPSGAGKGTVYGAVTTAMPQLNKSISVTTRLPRDGEKDGVHYYFRTEQEFARMREQGEFLECAEVYEHHYGSPAAPVLKMLSEGKDVFFEIDIEGAKQIKAKYPECVLIFLVPPSLQVLRARLSGRGTETEESLAKRFGSARSEMAQYDFFDYVVVNDDAAVATQEVMAIIAAERCKGSRNHETVREILNSKSEI